MTKGMRKTSLEGRLDRKAKASRRLSLIVYSVLFSIFFLGELRSVRAQETTDINTDDSTVESLYEKFENEDQDAKPQTPVEPRGKQDLKKISELSRLAPFEDIAVIQRRFLPKTSRFEISGAAAATLNDPFFNNIGGVARFGYYFREKYGVEFNYFFLTTAETQVTRDLRQKRGVLTESLVTTKSFYGADFKWSPIYGKVTLFGRRIVPFDLYFSLGGGLTQTDQGSGEPTIHLGTGQIFALSKSVAFRWDFSWNFFSAESERDGKKTSDTYDNLFLTVGVSFFFPEAKYR